MFSQKKGTSAVILPSTILCLFWFFLTLQLLSRNSVTVEPVDTTDFLTLVSQRGCRGEPIFPVSLASCFLSKRVCDDSVRLLHCAGHIIIGW